MDNFLCMIIPDHSCISFQPLILPHQSNSNSSVVRSNLLQILKSGTHLPKNCSYLLQ